MKALGTHAAKTSGLHSTSCKGETTVATEVKIGLIGAGSATFSGGIVRDLCVNPGLHGSHVTLMDVDEHRLAMIHRLAERLSGELGADLSFSATTDREQALRGADFVLNTAQVGGHDWTEAQRDLAEKHGYYRGVHLNSFGQIAFFLDVARDIERICPNAWLIQSGNPVFEGCTLMCRETSVKVLGLCHGHYGYRKIAQVLGLDLDRVTALSSGFNHWIWMHDFRYEGRDAYPLLDEWIETEAEAYWAETDSTRSYGDNQMTRAAIHQYQLFGLMPIGDTPRVGGWWYHTDLEAKKRWYGHLGGFDSEIGWSQYLSDIDKRVERVERAALDESRPVTETFEPKQSGEQIVPIIDSLVNDREAAYQVNIPNRGPILKGFPEDLVVECQGVVNGAGIRGVVVPPLPRKLVVGALIPRWKRAELLVEAVRTCDRDLLLVYLLEDPRTQRLDQAESLLGEWLADPRNADVARLFGT
jgi:alpha-galactosidase